MFKQTIAFIRQRRWLKILLEVLVILVIILAIRAWQTRSVVQGEAPVIIDQLISGEQVDLRNYRGKPVLVYFWAEWCPVCKMVDGSVDAIARDYAVITISSWPESFEDVARYLQKQSLQMPVIVDIQGQWAAAYGIRGVPASFIIDSNGVIRFVESGYTTETGLRLRLWWLEK